MSQKQNLYLKRRPFETANSQRQCHRDNNISMFGASLTRHSLYFRGIQLAFLESKLTIFCQTCNIFGFLLKIKEHENKINFVLSISLLWIGKRFFLDFIYGINFL